MREQAIDLQTVLYSQEQIEKKDWYTSYDFDVDHTVSAKDKIKTFNGTTAAATITLTLCSAADVPDRIIEIYKVDSGAGKITVDGNGAETINGAATIDIVHQYGGIRIKSDGSNWIILDYLTSSSAYYKWDSIDADVDIGSSDTDIQTYTIPSDGVYYIQANIEFGNHQDNTTDCNWILLRIKKGATILSESPATLRFKSGTTMYITIPINCCATFSKGDTLKITGRGQVANVLSVDTNGSNRSHYFIMKMVPWTAL